MSGDELHEAINAVIIDQTWVTYERVGQDAVVAGSGLAADAILALPEMQAMLAEVERLRAGINKLAEENYQRYVKIERLRAAGDALAEVSLGARPWITPLFAMEHGDRISAATAAWQEACRER